MDRCQETHLDLKYPEFFSIQLCSSLTPLFSKSIHPTKQVLKVNFAQRDQREDIFPADQSTAEDCIYSSNSDYVGLGGLNYSDSGRFKKH